MTDDEWGPWINHGGKGCPCVGQIVQVERRNGEFYGPYPAHSVGRKSLAGDPNFDTWVWLPKRSDVIRYRVRKPRAMKQIRALLEDLPERVDA